MVDPLIILLLFVCILSLGVFYFHRRYSSKHIWTGNKAVFITGCDTGFGHTLSITLHSKGFVVFAGCLFPDDEGANQLKAISSVKGGLHVLPLDVTSDKQVQNCLNYVKSHLNGLNLWALVNNAGIAYFSEVEWCPMEIYEKVTEVNVMGLVRVTKAFLPLIRQAEGRVVNIASLAGRTCLPGFSAYSISKAGCIAFSDSLRREMTKFGVKVILLEASLYRTPITSEDTHVSCLRKFWETVPLDIKQDYGEQYFEELVRVMQKYVRRSSKKTYQVIDMLTDAVMATRPRIRYVPNTQVRMGSNFLLTLPTWLQDHIVGVIMKVHCKPAMKMKHV